VHWHSGRVCTGTVVECALAQWQSVHWHSGRVCTGTVAECALVYPVIILQFEFHLLYVVCTWVGRDSTIGIVTGYGLGGPRIESRWGRDFPHPPVQTGPGAHPASYKMWYRVFPRGKAAGTWHCPPTRSSAEVKERVQRYLYTPSGPYKMWYRVFHGGKAAGAWHCPPTPSSAEVKERVQLYLYTPSGPSWSIIG
jgi:hypothetical protein